MSLGRYTLCFTRSTNGVFTTVSCGTESKRIPLLAEETPIKRALKSLNEARIPESMPFEIFYMTVAGSISTQMKCSTRRDIKQKRPL